MNQSRIKQFKLVSLVLIVLVALTGCSAVKKIFNKGGEEVVEDTVGPQEPKELKLDIVEKLETNQVIFEIQTNLPDGTKGRFDIKGIGMKYEGGANFKVEAGTATVGPFHNNKAALQKGDYEVSAIILPMGDQPVKVRPYLGDNYKYYPSQLIVKKGDETMIQLTKIFKLTIGTLPPPPKAEVSKPTTAPVASPTASPSPAAASPPPVLTPAKTSH